MKKNEFYEVQIEDMGSNGEGIGKVDGFPLFIKDAILGDVVRAQITKVKKNYGFARVDTIVASSKLRVEPACPVARQCGGCQIQALQYESQLAWKDKKVRNQLQRIAGIPKETVERLMEAPIGATRQYRYRNKMTLPVGCDKSGRLISGFYAGRTHYIVEQTDCMLGSQRASQIMEQVLSYMNTYSVLAYDETTGKGLVRHVLIREGESTGQVLVCLILNGTKLPQEEKLVETLCAIAGMTSIMININTKQTNVILGEETRVLWGQDHIVDMLNGLRFRISPLSFYQVNHDQAERLYSKTLEYAGLTGKETVWDLYCGIGTISLCLAKKAHRVYGVEIVPRAIEDARRNAQDNQIDNAEFFVGKAEDVFPQYMAEHPGVADPDVVVVDPPRKGCDEKLLETMLRMGPKKIVYVSCDSATMARDIAYLAKGGYTLKACCAVDQFCHTSHVETVCLMSRVEGK